VLAGSLQEVHNHRWLQPRWIVQQSIRKYQKYFRRSN